MYKDRLEAGMKLAKELKGYKGKDTVVMALPRGGVILGAEVAKRLKVPFGLVLVKKIGHPSYPEYAIGAIAENESPVYNEDEAIELHQIWLKQAENSARRVIAQRREAYYGQDFEPPKLKDKLVILVDDGIATGLTMKAAIIAVRNQHAKRVVVAVPVAPVESISRLETVADEVIVMDKPEDFQGAVGNHYQEFEQVDDSQVRTLLREARDAL